MFETKCTCEKMKQLKIFTHKNEYYHTFMT